MPEIYDPHGDFNPVVQRCFELHYLFIYADQPIGNMTELGRVISDLVNGNITNIHAGKFGPSEAMGYRVTIETEIECPDDPTLDKPGPDDQATVVQFPWNFKE